MRLKKAAGVLLAAIALMLPVSSWADAVYWTPATTSTSGYVFTAAEIASMKYYLRINASNPRDTTGSTGWNRAGTWYYIGETVGATSWPSNNQLTPLLISYGLSGQAVQFTVTQVFIDNGVERESQMSNVVTWTVDLQPPFFRSFSPDNGATGVPVGTTSFSFQYGDDGLYATGAKLSALSVTCPGYLATKTCSTGLLCTGTSSAYAVTVSGLSLGADNVVSCTLYGEDLEEPANKLTAAYSFTVESAAPAALQIETTTLASAQVGASICIPLTISGGTSGYSCDNTGVLPPGVPLRSNCSIGCPGILTEAGTYSFTVTATDAASATDNQAYSWEILPATPGGLTTVTLLDNTDTYLNSGSPAVNFSTSSEVRGYVWPSGVEANFMLYQGTTASLPDNVDVRSAKLVLNVTGHDGAGYDNMVLYVQPVTGAVNLDNVTWSNFGATRGVVVSSQTVGLVNGAVEFDILSVLKAAYLDSKAAYVVSVGSMSGGRQDQNRVFASAQHADASLRPKVVVTYMKLTGPPGSGAPSEPRRGKARLGPSSKPKYFR